MIGNNLCSHDTVTVGAYRRAVHLPHVAACRQQAVSSHTGSPACLRSQWELLRMYNSPLTQRHIHRQHCTPPAVTTKCIRFPRGVKCWQFVEINLFVVMYSLSLFYANSFPLLPHSSITRIAKNKTWLSYDNLHNALTLRLQAAQRASLLCCICARYWLTHNPSRFVLSPSYMHVGWGNNMMTGICGPLCN